MNAPTMAQARLRWNSYTKRVCKPDVLAAAKERTVWEKGYLPTLILGTDARYRFTFERTPYGNGTTFARQIFDGEKASVPHYFAWK